MKDIRNIAFVGASGAGKTSLVEQILYNAKATTRIGKVEDGNTVMDYNVEEIEKGMSMSLGMANFNWKNHKINILDTPGSADFVSEQISASTAVENLLLVANAAAGFEVSLEQSIELLERTNTAKGIIINRMDNEGADFFKALEVFPTYFVVLQQPTTRYSSVIRTDMKEAADLGVILRFFLHGREDHFFIIFFSYLALGLYG